MQLNLSENLKRALQFLSRPRVYTAPIKFRSDRNDLPVMAEAPEVRAEGGSFRIYFILSRGMRNR